MVRGWNNATFLPGQENDQMPWEILSLLVARHVQSPFRKVQVVISPALYHRTPNRTINLWRELLRMRSLYIRCEFGKSRPQSYAEFNSKLNNEG